MLFASRARTAFRVKAKPAMTIAIKLNCTSLGCLRFRLPAATVEDLVAALPKLRGLGRLRHSLQRDVQVQTVRLRHRVHFLGRLYGGGLKRGRVLRPTPKPRPIPSSWREADFESHVTHDKPLDPSLEDSLDAVDTIERETRVSVNGVYSVQESWLAEAKLRARRGHRRGHADHNQLIVRHRCLYSSRAWAWKALATRRSMHFADRR